MMDSLNCIREKYLEVHKPFQDDEKLTQFIRTLEQYNCKNPLDEDFKNKLLSFFEYKWEKDNN